MLEGGLTSSSVQVPLPSSYCLKWIQCIFNRSVKNVEMPVATLVEEHSVFTNFQLTNQSPRSVVTQSTFRLHNIQCVHCIFKPSTLSVRGGRTSFATSGICTTLHRDGRNTGA